MTEKFFSFLECQKCRGELRRLEASANCVRCGALYLINNGAWIFNAHSAVEHPDGVGDPLIASLKGFFKRYEKLYFLFVKIAGALFIGKTGRQAFAQLPPEAIVINLGSGPKKLGQNIINVDSFAFPGVQIVADAIKLPIKNASVDAMMCECVLEHVPDPIDVVKEISRVLKPGGLVYISIPFMDAYHSAPDDYYRWTTSGLRQLMKDFDEMELKLAFGPTSTMISGLSHWLGIFLSFGSKTIYQIIMLSVSVLFSPLKLLDYVLRNYPYATNASVGFYYIGRNR